MTKNILKSTVVLALFGLTTQCKPIKNITNQANQEAKNDSALYASLTGEENYALHGPIMIKFTVTNPTDDTLKFTQYHTPFEGMISKFLSVKDSVGNEINYIGAMTRRVMPPPAETYHTVAPGETKSVTFDLKKGYKIEKAGQYTLQYEDENISGVANGKPIVITVVPKKLQGVVSVSKDQISTIMN